MKKGIYALFLTSLIVLLFIYVCYVQNSLPILCDDSLTMESKYWQLGGWCYGTGSNFQQWQNGIAYLNVSNPNGDNWIGSKIQQGSLPHGWNQAYSLAYNPIVSGNTKLYLEIRFKIGSYSFLKYPCNTDNSYAWFNFAVALWMQRENTIWNSSDSQMCVGLNIVWLKYDGNIVYVQKEDVYFKGDVGNDSHSLFNICNGNVEPYQWITLKADVSSHVHKALNHWSEQKAILRCVEVYVETIGAQGEVWVDRVYLTAK